MRCLFQNKIGYDDRKEAQNVLKGMIQRRPNETINVYYCKHCGLYHIGHDRYNYFKK